MSARMWRKRWDTPEKLRLWGEQVVRPAAELAAKGDGELCSGAWCRFCKIKGSCRARAAAYTALEDFGNPTPHEMTPRGIGRALQMGEGLAGWLSDLQEYALNEALLGHKIPGWKAVAGRTSRKWTDEDAAFTRAQQEGVPEVLLYERKRLTLAALEKQMGKGEFAKMLGEYVEQSPGKPTLVSEKDKRPAITTRITAEEDFKNTEE